MNQNGAAPHETMELHELFTFKNICMTKSVTMKLLVSDDELKALLDQDASMSQKHILELRGLIGK